MNPAGQLLLSVFASFICFTLGKVFRVLVRQFVSPLRNIPGPKSPSLVYGNMRDIWDSETLHQQWVKQYGITFRYSGLFNTHRLFTMDTRAINHILTHSKDYQKPSQLRYILGQIVGEGLLVVEGAQHRQQRRIMNPAFGPSQIRGLTDVYFSKAIKLRDIWSSEITEHHDVNASGISIDVMPWIARATLDVIGLAGFNYNFDTLNADKKPDELDEAFSRMIAAALNLSLLPTLQTWIRPLRVISSSRQRKIQAAHRTTSRIGKELLTEAKTLARSITTEKGEIEKDRLGGRDLLSLLVKANMATDIPESQRLKDADVLAQVPTFLVAGHETTSTSTIWALYALAQRPDMQTKLREELLSVDTEMPSMDDLMALPVLDAVVRETLRVYAPVPATLRIAMKNDVLPLETPFTGNDGLLYNSVRINKGDSVFIPISSMNRSEGLWGPDADEFRPERWENLPEAVSSIPGVWSHLMTFLGGPRACIGYRFSIVEIKALVFTLIRAFEFELAVTASEIRTLPTIIRRPFLRDDPTRKCQLPLVIRPHRRD
ncbi:cytochrome P450 [Phlebopus sp. FC_14]|nr:cytochrome P450 [Phlebopus sp. FC_14]